MCYGCMRRQLSPWSLEVPWLFIQVILWKRQIKELFLSPGQGLMPEPVTLLGHFGKPRTPCPACVTGSFRVTASSSGWMCMLNPETSLAVKSEWQIGCDKCSELIEWGWSKETTAFISLNVEELPEWCEQLESHKKSAFVCLECDRAMLPCSEPFVVVLPFTAAEIKVNACWSLLTWNSVQGRCMKWAVLSITVTNFENSNNTEDFSSHTKAVYQVICFIELHWLGFPFACLWLSVWKMGKFRLSGEWDCE